MLTCIACSKHQEYRNRAPPEEDDNPATPSTKQAVESFTSQIKEIAIKAYGAYKICKACARHDRDRPFEDLDSEKFYSSYRKTSSLKSTPPDKETVSKGFSSGSATPVSISGRTESILFLEEEEYEEWEAQVEPGVLITFVSLGQSGNDMKRIRFSRDIFDKLQAQKWWADNCDKVMELYNVQRFHRESPPLPTPSQSEDENSRFQSPEPSSMKPLLNKDHHHPSRLQSSTRSDYSSPASVRRHHPMQKEQCQNSSVAALNPTPNLFYNIKTECASSNDASSPESHTSREIDYSGELCMSSVSDQENEWVERDEPGVYITIRSLLNGCRELRRVRFSRQRFGETEARMWWEENKSRIQKQYL